MWMMLRRLVLAGLLAIMLHQICLANHEQGHVEPALRNSPLIDAILNPQLQLPGPSPSSLVPTDISSIGGSLGRAQGLEGKLTRRPGARTAEDKRWQLKRDDRYSFTGQWLPFWTDNTVADAVSDRAIAQAHDKARPASRREGQIEERVVLLGKEAPREAVFMATWKASYTRKSQNELVLSDGAILLKTGDKPVFVSLELHNQKVTAQFAGATISMISLMDARPIVLNLTDKHRGACSLFVHAAAQAQSVKCGPGEVAEIYARDTQPASNIVASEILVTQALDNNFAIQIAKYNCVAALKRYNIARNLSRNDVERVIKTAAALAYIRRPSAAKQ